MHVTFVYTVQRIPSVMMLSMLMCEWKTTIIFLPVKLFTVLLYSFGREHYRNDNNFSRYLKIYFNYIQMHGFNRYFIYRGTGWIFSSGHKLGVLHISRNSTHDCVVNMHLRILPSVRSRISYISIHKYA